MILSTLTPVEIYRLSITGRILYDAAQGYRRRAFQINNLLVPFFKDTGVESFRRLQQRTGTLISGSQALHFFNRTAPDIESDMDIYVEHRYADEAARFLISPEQAYVFVPKGEQVKNVFEAIQLRENNWDEERAPDYLDRGIGEVYNFVRRDGMKVQMITARGSTLEIILQFHSSE
jgi:hypothetical protein